MGLGHVEDLLRTGASVDWQTASSTACQTEGHVDRTGGSMAAL